MFDNLRNSFLDKGIFLKDSWLHSMIDSGLKNYESIFTPLLNTDISETCEPCPMPDLTRNPKFIYQGNDDENNFALSQIFLQINEVIDISLPLEKRRALERSDRSTLKILMTDGVKKFVAISKSPISSFSTDVTPGAKIFIKTPIESRYGIIFLFEEQIDFLRGKSQQLIDYRKQIYSKKTNSSQQNQQRQNQAPKSNQEPSNNHPEVQKSNQTSFPKQQKSKNMSFLSDSSDNESIFSDEDTVSSVQNHFIDSSSFSDNVDSQLFDDDIESVDESDFDNLPSFNKKRNNKQPSTNKKNQSNMDNAVYVSDSSDEDIDIIDQDEINSSKSNLQKSTRQNFLSDNDNIDFSEFSQPINKKAFYTVYELINKKSPPQEECFEEVKTNAKILNCLPFNFYKEGKKEKFSLNVILKDSSGQIKVSVDPKYILQVIKMKYDDFINLTSHQMDNTLSTVNDYFQSLNPPLTLLDNGKSANIRYNLVGC